MKIGSLFSGSGQLDVAVQQVFGGDIVWHAEPEVLTDEKTGKTRPNPAVKVLAHHWPDVPNLGDVSVVDWASAPAVDVMCGGYPCQPFSTAGKRVGTDDDRHLWPYFVEAISSLNPRYVVLENVAGHLSLGFDEVVGDLAIMGYKVSWCVLAASDVGAPHQRKRIFALAEDSHERRVCSGPDRRRGLYRDSGSRWLVSSTPQGFDDGQGVAGVESNAPHLRREDRFRAQASGSEAPRCVHMAVDGNACLCGSAEGPSISDGQSYAGGHRARLSGDGRQFPSSAKWSCNLDGGDAFDGCDIRCSYSGGESSRSGSAVSGCASGCSVAGRSMVGTERWSVRSDSVRGSIPCEWSDDRWPGVQSDVALLPTPAASRSGNNQSNSPGAAVRPSLDSITDLLPTPTARDHKGPNQRQDMSCLHGALLPTPRRSDGDGGANPLSRAERMDDVETRVIRCDGQWGRYEPAIRRWENLTRPAPSPTEPNTQGNPRLAAPFPEWMQGWPAGWVTAVPGLSRNDQLRLIGNGVCPQQAVSALWQLVSVIGVAA